MEMVKTEHPLYYKNERQLNQKKIDIYIYTYNANKKVNAGNSPVDQWSGLGTFTGKDLCSVPGRELRSHKPCGMPPSPIKKL